MYELIDVDILNKSLPAVVVDGVEFLVGVQIANLVGKETFNLYRSLKRIGVEIRRGTPEVVNFLRTCGVVGHTHSVTLVPYHGILNYLNKIVAKEATSSLSATGMKRSFQQAMLDSECDQHSCHKMAKVYSDPDPFELLVAISVEELHNLAAPSLPYKFSLPPLSSLESRRLSIGAVC